MIRNVQRLWERNGSDKDDIKGNMKFWKAVKKGIEGAKESFGPGYYSFMGRKIECPICGNDVFFQGSILLNTFHMTLLDMAWADKKATTLACRVCGHILWFIKEPERMGAAKDK
jgi:hypothetical protein